MCYNQFKSGCPNALIQTFQLPTENELHGGSQTRKKKATVALKLLVCENQVVDSCSIQTYSCPL